MQSKLQDAGGVCKGLEDVVGSVKGFLRAQWWVPAQLAEWIGGNGVQPIIFWVLHQELHSGWVGATHSAIGIMIKECVHVFKWK